VAAVAVALGAVAGEALGTPGVAAEPVGFTAGAVEDVEALGDAVVLDFALPAEVLAPAEVLGAAGALGAATELDGA